MLKQRCHRGSKVHCLLGSGILQQVCTSAHMEEHILVCMVEGTQARMQACKAVGKLAHTQERMLVCKVVGMQERKQARKLEHILARKLVCMLVEGSKLVEDSIQADKALVLGKQVCKPEGKHLVRSIQADRVDHNIQMNCSSHDCRSIPPIGALSLPEEATRH